MIYTEITQSQFVEAIVNDPFNSMSYDGADALYDYIVSTDEDIEFTPIDIRIEYSELDITGIIDMYSHILNTDEINTDEINTDEINTIIDTLQEHTTVIKINGSDRFIVQNQ